MDAPRIRGTRNRLANLWRPAGLVEQVDATWPGHATGEAALIFWRGRALLFPVYLVLVALGLIVLILWLTGHRPVFPFLVLGTIAAMHGLVLHALRLWFLLKLGGWSRRGRSDVRRAEQPVRFWTWAAASSCIVALWMALTCYMDWTLYSWG